MLSNIARQDPEKPGGSKGIHYDRSTLILLAAESNKLLMIEIERTVLRNSAVGECTYKINVDGK